MALIRSKIDNRKWKEIMRNVEKMGRKVVRVGVIGTEAATPHLGDPITIGEIAGVHEYGAVIAQKHGILVIPQRSFIRRTIVEDKALISRLIQKLGEAVLNGKRSEEQALAVLGLKLVARMQLLISRGLYPPNAPSTVARKGSSKPLIASGRLRQSISSAVVDKG